MKFELKTEKENYSKSFLHFFGIFFFLTLIIILSDVALKLGIISRHYQIDYNCRLLPVKKSALNIKKLSRLSNLKSKQKIWEILIELLVSGIFLIFSRRFWLFALKYYTSASS